MNNAKLVKIILRVGIASAFIYAAVAAIINPPSWIGYLQQLH